MKTLTIIILAIVVSACGGERVIWWENYKKGDSGAIDYGSVPCSDTKTQMRMMKKTGGSGCDGSLPVYGHMNGYLSLKYDTVPISPYDWSLRTESHVVGSNKAHRCEDTAYMRREIVENGCVVCGDDGRYSCFSSRPNIPGVHYDDYLSQNYGPDSLVVKRVDSTISTIWIGTNTRRVVYTKFPVRDIYKATMGGRIVLIRTDTAKVIPEHIEPERLVWP